MNPQEQIAGLRAQLRHHNEKYYNEDAPEISDYEYDMMQRELRQLEQEYPEFADENSPTQRVGGAASGRFPKVSHTYPLESLQDVFSFDELDDFFVRVETRLVKRNMWWSTRSMVYRSLWSMKTACLCAVQLGETVR